MHNSQVSDGMMKDSFDDSSKNPHNQGIDGTQPNTSSRGGLIDIQTKNSQVRQSHNMGDSSSKHIEERATREENDEQEMIVGSNRPSTDPINDLQLVKRPFSMRGSLNMIIRKNEQKNII